MSKKLIGAIMFAAGAAIGSVATWFAVKTKYEQIAQEEIDSVREEYGNLKKLMRKEIEACRRITDANQNENDSEEAEDNSPEYEQMKIDYRHITNKYRSSEDEDNDDDEIEKEGDEEGEDEVPYTNGPYVISPDTFGDEPSYSAQPLDYFADGILADGWGDKLDIEETIGEDALNHFGDWVDDVVHVRNERTEIDYEVTKDPRTYEEAMEANPNPYYGQ